MRYMIIVKATAKSGAKPGAKPRPAAQASFLISLPAPECKARKSQIRHGTLELPNAGQCPA
jgi:hypothetical protein